MAPGSDQTNCEVTRGHDPPAAPCGAAELLHGQKGAVGSPDLICNLNPMHLIQQPSCRIQKEPPVPPSALRGTYGAARMEGSPPRVKWIPLVGTAPPQPYVTLGQTRPERTSRLGQQCLGSVTASGRGGHEIPWATVSSPPIHVVANRQHGGLKVHHFHSTLCAGGQLLPAPSPREVLWGPKEGTNKSTEEEQHHRGVAAGEWQQKQ